LHHPRPGRGRGGRAITRFVGRCPGIHRLRGRSADVLGTPDAVARRTRVARNRRRRDRATVRSVVQGIQRFGCRAIRLLSAGPLTSRRHGCLPVGCRLNVRTGGYWSPAWESWKVRMGTLWNEDGTGQSDSAPASETRLPHARGVLTRRARVSYQWHEGGDERDIPCCRRKVPDPEECVCRAELMRKLDRA